ncbi:hypothetical protein ABTF01_21355, partial [Acinetobacter baumannii]
VSGTTRNVRLRGTDWAAAGADRKTGAASPARKDRRRIISHPNAAEGCRYGKAYGRVRANAMPICGRSADAPGYRKAALCPVG